MSLKLLIGSFGGVMANKSYIKSIQPVSITISSGNTSNTATITGVAIVNAIILYQGLTCTSTSALASVVSRIELTNSTTVTAFRGVSNSDAITINAVVIEFSSQVNSIQAGTIAANGVASATATITAVSANAFVLYLGQTTTTAETVLSRAIATVALTNSTTVTAFNPLSTANMTVGYMVVDLSSVLVKSVQKLAHVDTSNTTSYTDTISSVAVANTLLLYNGDSFTSGSGASSFEVTRQLTNSTTVTYTLGVGNASATSKTSRTTVLEFQPNILNAPVQRGVITISSGASATAAITSIPTAKSFANWCGWNFSSGTPAASFPNLTLTSSTVITAALNSTETGGPKVSYEAVWFI